MRAFAQIFSFDHKSKVDITIWMMISASAATQQPNLQYLWKLARPVNYGFYVVLCYVHSYTPRMW